MSTKEKILLETYNLTQLQPIRGCQFLFSPCVIPYYKIIPLIFLFAHKMTIFKIQQIAKTIYKELIENSQLIDEFEWICKNFTFVDLWHDPDINPRNVSNIC